MARGTEETEVPDLGHELAPQARDDAPAAWPEPNAMLAVLTRYEQAHPERAGMARSLRELLHRPEVLEGPLPTIAFCTATLRRTYQVRWALPLVLLALWPYQRNVRVFLVDFNSDDEGDATALRELVAESCFEALQTGLLQFYRCDSQPTWHACICKNSAHYAACDSGWPSHVVNLDCDRIVYAGFAPRLLRLFQQQTDAVAHASNNWHSGTYGTVGCSVARYRALRGYDEDFLPSGCQDTDLMRRLQRAGCPLVRVTAANEVGYTLPNSEDGDVRMQILVKVQNVDVKYAGMKWGRMDEENRRAMHEKASIIARNTGPQWRPREAVLVDL
ncbi:MAG: hypothetical protein GY772_08880, partial [bacterium]|nr:hypothetical protein [bacterium]